MELKSDIFGMFHRLEVPVLVRILPGTSALQDENKDILNFSAQARRHELTVYSYNTR